MLITPRLMVQHVGRNRAKTIGFIGLGAMGREMATNLLSKTFQASNDDEMTFVVHDSMDQVSRIFEFDYEILDIDYFNHLYFSVYD